MRKLSILCVVGCAGRLGGWVCMPDLIVSVILRDCTPHGANGPEWLKQA